MTSHQPVKLKGLPWLVCKRCGLVWLRNEATRKAIAAGCD